MTKDKYIEMWATVKAIEYDIIHFPIDKLGSPVVRASQTGVLKGIERNLNWLKFHIQQEIGSME